MVSSSFSPEEVCNINVGIMGHVDSGKTSLVKCLSSILSTAALDKNPQSRQRGITLDLGFSAFISNLPDHIQSEKYKYIQYTLVDCPGHASLIRTILGGAQIIDMLIIVVDCLKGIQTQTAECMVIGEITTDKAIFVLNKIDLIPEAERADRVKSITATLQKTISRTRFKNAPIIPVSAQVGGGSIEDENTTHIGMDSLVETIQKMITIPNKDDNEPFYYMYDHVFNLPGKGCVMTGTVLKGHISVNDEIEFPIQHITRKVKSIQMFHKNIQTVYKGDRAGICVQAFDYKSERGEVCQGGSLIPIQSVLIRLKKIRFFKGDVKSGSTFHISIGHHTIPGTLTLFTDTEKQEVLKANQFGVNVFSEEVNSFDFSRSYLYTEMMNILFKLFKIVSLITHPNLLLLITIVATLWALLQLDQVVYAPLGSLLIGSQLSGSANDPNCRIAFYGKVVNVIEDTNLLKVYKPKERTALIDRVVDEYECIGTNLVDKGGNVLPFVGLKVITKEGIEGVIESSFGKAGKFKVVFQKPHNLNKNGELIIQFRRYIYDKDKKICQE